MKEKEILESEKINNKKSHKVKDIVNLIIDLISWALIIYVGYIWIFKMGGCPPLDRCQRCYENVTTTGFQVVKEGINISSLNLTGII